jgi:hypothetical protein
MQHFFDRLVACPWLTTTEVFVWTVVAQQLHSSVRYFHRLAGTQLVDSGNSGVWSWYVQLHQVFCDAVWTKSPIRHGFEQRRNFGGKYNAGTQTGFTRPNAIVQRLDAQAITNQPCNTMLLIPQRNRKHAS